MGRRSGAGKAVTDPFGPRPGRGVLCAVTAPPDPAAPAEQQEAQLTENALAAVGAGVDIVQLRAPGLSAAVLLRVTDTIVAAVRDGRTRVVVNERLDVALAGGAHGVHLRSSSLPAGEVRRLAPAGFLVGRSVHGVDEAETVLRAGGLDYLVAGTVFPSESKPAGHGTLGLEGLAAICRRVEVPVLAIGGITVERVAGIAATGAAGVAAIGLFRTPAGQAPADAAKTLGKVVQSVRIAFDSRARRH